MQKILPKLENLILLNRLGKKVDSARIRIKGHLALREDTPVTALDMMLEDLNYERSRLSGIRGKIRKHASLSVASELLSEVDDLMTELDKARKSIRATLESYHSLEDFHGEVELLRFLDFGPEELRNENKLKELIREFEEQLNSEGLDILPSLAQMQSA